MELDRSMPVPLEGSLESSDLASVLWAIAEQKTTGILTVQGDLDILAISFLEGRIVSADSLNRSLEDGLGDVLASEQLVRPEDYSVLSAEYHAGGGRVVDLLVERNFVTREDLLRALRLHTTNLLIDVLRWRMGEYKFYVGDEVSFEDDFQPITVEELLIHAARELVEVGPLGELPPEPDVVFERMPDGDTSRPPLGEEEAKLLAEVDGRRSVADLLEGAAHSEFRLLLMLHRLSSSGWIRSRDVPAEEGDAAARGRLPVEDLLASFEEVPVEVESGAAPARKFSSLFRFPPSVRRWAIGLISLVAVAAFLNAAISAPSGVVLPFPWLSGVRSSVQASQRLSRVLAIDHAARTHFLLEGSFPESLEELVEKRWLSPVDLTDPDGGHPFVYSGGGTTFVLRRAGGALASERAVESASVDGDFLLDADFAASPRSERPLLVLLD